MSSSKAKTVEAYIERLRGELRAPRAEKASLAWFFVRSQNRGQLQ